MPARRLLCITPRGRIDPAGRKRIFDLVPLLRAAGHSVHTLDYEWEWLWRTRGYADVGDQRAAALLRMLNVSRLAGPLIRARGALTRRRFAALVRRADVVVVNQTPLDASWRDVLRRCARAVVYDVDDAVWLRGGAEAEMFSLATAVVAGNAYLAERAATLNAHVVVIPTTVRIDTYRGAARAVSRNTDECVVGWVGSPTTTKYLEMLVEPLATVGAERPLALHVVGCGGATLPSFRNVRLHVHRQLPYDPADHVPSFDVGVMPLTDGEWERGKCAAKALEYMAAGVATVCSPVGENARVVEHGISGLLAGSAGEWIDALRRLAADPSLRHALGTAGRARVRESYSAERAVALWNAWLAEHTVTRAAATATRRADGVTRHIARPR